MLLRAEDGRLEGGDRLSSSSQPAQRLATAIVRVRRYRRIPGRPLETGRRLLVLAGLEQYLAERHAGTRVRPVLEGQPRIAFRLGESSRLRRGHRGEQADVRLAGASAQAAIVGSQGGLEVALPMAPTALVEPVAPPVSHLSVPRPRGPSADR